MKTIGHENEVLKCRMNTADDSGTIASILTSGVVNIYSIDSDDGKLGCLLGLTEESFCLDWNKKRNGLLASAAGSVI